MVGRTQQPFILLVAALLVAGMTVGEARAQSGRRAFLRPATPRRAQRVQPPGKPWTIPQPKTLQALGIKTGGWLEQGITLNQYNPADGTNGPLATNDWANEYQMNQLWLYFTKPTDTQKKGYDFGGHLDLVYGSDWRFGVNNGLENRINGDGQSYGMIIPQAYLEFAVGRLTVKGGHFAGILGYEVVPAIFNPFYSHSYAMSYTEPLLVTGMLADYKLTDQWTITGGFHRGWMMWEDNNNVLDFMGGVKWESLDKRTSVAYALSTGPQDPGGLYQRTVYSLVARHKLTDRLEYILQHNLGVEDQPGGGQAEWYGILQYAKYQLNKKWAACLRVEWLRDDDGRRVIGLGNMPWAAGRAWAGGSLTQPSFVGNFYELTAGFQWRPTPNWLIRPELRWDWYNGTRDPSGALPFNDGNDNSQLTIAADASFIF